MNRIFHPFRSASQQLGPLEQRLLEALWARRSATVRELVEDGYQNLAYTTVMTTLDRLFKKGMLERRKSERAFIYSPRLSRREWERQCAGEMMAGFLAGPRQSGELLISCLVDQVGGDARLLDELERKIKIKRQELNRRKP